jgi:hypothetical protein
MILLLGCHSQTLRPPAPGGISDNLRLEILAAVFVHMGRSQEANLRDDTLLLLRLGDSDYSWIDHRFRVTSPGFRYAQLAASARPSHGEEVLAIELESANNTHASAKGTFATDKSIAVYKYEVVLGPKGWKVTSSELFFAS